MKVLEIMFVLKDIYAVEIMYYRIILRVIPSIL